MLGNCCPQKIMRTKEGIDEITAMQAVHRRIPGHSHCQTQQRAAYKMHPLQHAPVPLPQKKQSNNQSRQQHANRPLRQHCKTCRAIHDIPIARLAVAIAKIEEQQRCTEEKEQHGISNHRFADEKKLHTAQEHQRTAKAAALIVQLAAAPGHQGQAAQAKQRREKARSKLRKAKHFIGQGCQPIKENRLIIPIMAINLRRKPVTAQNHLLCRQRIVRLHAVRNQQAAITCKKQHCGS